MTVVLDYYAYSGRTLIFTVNDVYLLDNLSRLKSFVNRQISLIKPDNYFITLNGDFLSPSLLSSLDGGRLMIQAIREVGFSYVGLGYEKHPHLSLLLFVIFLMLFTNLIIVIMNLIYPVAH
jgi:hypothetical protein